LKNRLVRQFAALLLFLLLTILTLGATQTHAQPVSQSVTLPNQQYRKSMPHIHRPAITKTQWIPAPAFAGTGSARE
jgi:hypothetical protein